MWTPLRAKGGMYEYEHKNGLKLLLIPRDGVDVTTANITYHVGSRNEGLGLTGATHYLEHGMFKGSKKFNGKLGMWKLEELGAVLNATTYVDRTNYFEVIESKYLNECIAREADRMLQPLLTQELLNSEMSVVRNEYERGCNNDFEFIHKRLMATAFMAHPYHHSTIGWKSDIENVSAEALTHFHDTFYVPNNATYTFVGNFAPEDVKDMVGKAFSNIPRGHNIPNMYTKEPLQMGQRRVLERRPSNTGMVGIGFKAPAGLHRDAIVLQVIAELMTNGTDSVAEPLRKSSDIHDVIAFWERMKDPYLFTVWGTTNYPTKQAVVNAENAITDMLRNFPRPTEERLTAIKNSIENSWKTSMEGTQGMASEVNEAISRGDAFDVFNRFDVLKDVTADDVKRVADKYFDFDKSTVAVFYPGKEHTSNISDETYSKPSYEKAPRTLKAPKSTSVDFSNVKTAKGYAYCQYPSSKTHLFLSIDADTKYRAKDVMVNKLLSSIMTKGASTMTEKNIDTFLQNNGVIRSIGGNTSGVTVQLSVPNTEQLLQRSVKLMKGELNQPSMKRKDFDYLKEKLTAEMNGLVDDVDMTCRNAFYAALFDPGDSNYRYSTQELSKALSQISYRDVTTAHKRLLQQGKTRVTMLSPQQVALGIKTQDKPYTFTRVRNTSAPAVTRIHIPGKASCTVNMGMEVTPTLALRLGVGALGAGFAGRLMKIVRDKYGLTYGIGANTAKVNGTGILKISATFNPDLLEKGMKHTNELVDQWFTGDVTQEELDIQKQMLIGSTKVGFDDTQSIALAIHMKQLRREDVAELDAFSSKVQAVTLKNVRDAIRSLDKKQMKTVIVGTLH